MVLDRNAENFFAENEQAAFGTGVLVDGLDFSDDKMLVGRTFSYSDTQRYRVGPNYLQLPVNAPATRTSPPTSATAQMAYYVDGGGENPHVNYEPIEHGRAGRGRQAAGAEHGPEVAGRVGRAQDRAHQRLRAGRRALPHHGPSGSATTWSPTWSTTCCSATGASRSAWSGTSPGATPTLAGGWPRAWPRARPPLPPPPSWWERARRYP